MINKFYRFRNEDGFKCDILVFLLASIDVLFRLFLFIVMFFVLYTGIIIHYFFSGYLDLDEISRRKTKKKKKRKKHCNASFTLVSVLVSYDIKCEYGPHRVL